jgi:hypothetical protein
MTEFTPPSPPEPWSELLAGYVLGDLTSAEITLVEQYLAQHPEQQTEVASLMLPLDLLPLSLPADLPPASLRQQIMQIAEADQMIPQTVTPQPAVQLHRPNLSLSANAASWLAGISLLLSTGLGWQNYRLTQELATARNYESVVGLLQQPNNRFLALKSMGKKPMGMGSLVMAPQKSSALLTLQQVPPVPSGQVYRVWAILGDGEMACGDFLPDASGQVLMKLPLNSWDKVNKVTITIEDKGAVHAVGEIAIEGESQI